MNNKKLLCIKESWNFYQKRIADSTYLICLNSLKKWLLVETFMSTDTACFCEVKENPHKWQIALSRL